MALARLPDWSIYGGVVIAMVVAAVAWRETADAPASGPAVEGRLIGASSIFQPAVIVRTPSSAPHAAGGTAFSISKAGVWLTARHAVEGCRKVALLIGTGSGVVADVHPDRTGDVAVVTTVGGPPGLPLALDERLRVGERGFHLGYPQGAPGEVTTRLLGRQTLVMRWPKRLRGAHAEPVVAWAETGRTAGLQGDLAGLSGAPVLDEGGRVIGLTLAETTRRARLYTAAPDTLARVLRRLRVRIAPGDVGAPTPVTTETYGGVAAVLRRTLQVAQVRCLD